jgi:hypothetical protein
VAEVTATATTCRSCGAPIWWAHTTAGRLIPVDNAPVDSGNIVTTGRQNVSESITGVVCSRPEVKVEEPGMLPDDRPRYVAHFATCPNADEWRKR